MYKRPVIITGVLVVMMMMFVALFHMSTDDDEDILSSFYHTTNSYSFGYTTAEVSTYTIASNVEPEADPDAGTNGSPPSMSPSMPGVAPTANTVFPTGDVAQVVNAYKTDSRYFNAYYSEKIQSVDIGGHTFAWDVQSSNGVAAWANYTPDESTMAGAGCFFYATAALIGAKQGTYYSLEQMVTNAGGVVTVEGDVFKVANSPWPNLAGSDTRLRQLLQQAGLNATVENVTPYKSDGSINLDNAGLADGSVMYIQYQKADPATTSNPQLSSYHSDGNYFNHWTATVGTYNGKYIVLGNGSRDSLVTSSAYHDIVYLYKVTFN